MCNTKSADRATQPFRLGDWCVEPAVNRISRGNEIVQVAPRAMEVLLCLAQSPGQLVTKQELIDSVWKEQFVSVAALTRCIANLRKFLGDDARHPQFVENIPRRGYRLVVAPQPLSDEQISPVSETALCWLTSGKSRFLLADGTHAVGRSPNAMVRIDSSMVSRNHARITVVGARATLEDLGSKNGTLVGERRIQQPYILQSGDRITIGPAVLVFQVQDGQGTTRTGVSSCR